MTNGWPASGDRRSFAALFSLELGGSKDIGNLYPEEGTLPGGAPGSHVKDKLEHKVHDMVCAALFKRAFGVAP
jgi:hypothetical protein